MTPDIFLKLDKIKGESQDKTHKGEIDVESFTFGVSNGGDWGTGGGGGAGKAVFQDVSIAKRVDSSTPNLFKACATGEHIATGLLTVRKSGGEKQEFYKIDFKDIIITSISNTGANGGIPSEMVTLNFAEMKFAYKEQKSDGSLGGVVQFGWNVKKGDSV